VTDADVAVGVDDLLLARIRLAIARSWIRASKLLVVFTLLRGWLTLQVATVSEGKRGAITY
jgi:hypothetical protein